MTYLTLTATTLAALALLAWRRTHRDRARWIEDFRACVHSRSRTEQELLRAYQDLAAAREESMVLREMLGVVREWRDGREASN